MLLLPTEVDVQLMKMLQKGSKRRALGHLGKGIHILGEAFATITILAVGARGIGVGVVDITRQ